jgi:DoxX-like protein
MKMKMIGYWAATALVVFGLLFGGAAQLSHQRETVEGLRLLGYPPYFASIIGAWKILGGVVLLAPRLPRLKEWAYAGAFFVLTGAVVSHAACGDAIGRLIGPGIFAALVVVSWALRPPSRMLGALEIPALVSSSSHRQAPVRQ